MNSEDTRVALIGVIVENPDSVDALNDILQNAPKWWNTGDKEKYDNLIFIIPPTKYEEVYNTIGEPSKDIEKIEELEALIFLQVSLHMVDL